MVIIVFKWHHILLQPTSLQAAFRPKAIIIADRIKHMLYI